MNIQFIKEEKCQKHDKKIKLIIIQNIEELNDVSQQWMMALKNSINIGESLKAGLELLDLDQNQLNRQFEFNCKTNIIKLSSLFQRLFRMEGIQVCKEQFMELMVSNYNKAIQKQQFNTVTWQQVNQIKQEEECHAVAFNNAGNIMVAGFNENIKVWEFDDGKINELAILKSKGKLITCLRFSKKNQWFISSNRSGTIQLWKQGHDSTQWQSSIPQNQQDVILCLLLNQKEDQLISSSLAKSVFVWGINYLKNELEYLYAFYNHHTLIVNSLNQNEQDTSLISCGSDKQIILWLKGENNKWKYRDKFLIENPLQVCFVNENQFVVSQDQKGYLNLFIISEQKLLMQQDKRIQLRSRVEQNVILFPPIYNLRNNIIIQRLVDQVFIIKQENNGQFKVQRQPIDCETCYNYGSLSENGNDLVIWNQKTKEFRVFQLIYELLSLLKCIKNNKLLQIWEIQQNNLIFFIVKYNYFIIKIL